MSIKQKAAGDHPAANSNAKAASLNEDNYITRPHSPEAEEAVLGAILITPEVFYEVAEILQEDDFFLHRHRFIWQACEKLVAQQKPLDLLTVTERLHMDGKLNEVGGPAFLTKLLNQVPTSLHAVGYARMVEEHALRRRLLHAAQKIAGEAMDTQKEVSEILDTSEQAVFSVSQRQLGHHMRPFSLLMQELMTQIEEASQIDNPMLGLPSGFSELDALLGGLRPSSLIIGAGRPSMGKTSFVVSLVRQVLQQQKKVAFFSIEMSDDEISVLLLAQESGLPIERLPKGKFTPEEWQRLYAASKTAETWPLHLDDSPVLTPSQVRSRCRKVMLEGGLDLVIIDYLQLMHSGTRAENRTQEVANISRDLKILARELEVPVFALAQLSRAVEQRADKRPMLSDLRESGALEQDADVVMFLYRPEKYDALDASLKGKAEVIVAKHRKGPTGVVPLHFVPEKMMFQNVPEGRFA
jgi:replicative DNA helicase